MVKHKYQTLAHHRCVAEKHKFSRLCLVNQEAFRLPMYFQVTSFEVDKLLVAKFNTLAFIRTSVKII